MGKIISFDSNSSVSGRLDHFIFEHTRVFTVPPSRSQIQRWIRAGMVRVDGSTVTKTGTKIELGEKVELELRDEERELEPYDFPVEIMYEDQWLIVVNKPPGLTMHPGAGNRSKTLLNALVGRFSEFKSEGLDRNRLGIVHRLDKDTSGVVVLAKTASTQTVLSKQFASREVFRAYLALVAVTPRGKRLVQQLDHGTIETMVARSPTAKTKMAVVKEGGRKAITHFKTVRKMQYACLLELRLQTGRTHQIRVHMEHVLSPVVGDKTYGNFHGLPLNLRKASDAFGRQALHAYKLGFRHPETAKPLEFTAPLPADFQKLIALFENPNE